MAKLRWEKVDKVEKDRRFYQDKCRVSKEVADLY